MKPEVRQLARELAKDSIVTDALAQFIGQIVEEIHASKVAPAIARAERAESELAVIREALEPFADFGEFMEVETEGFSDTDRLNLVPEESDVVIGDLFVAAFRRARAALANTADRAEEEKGK